MVKLKTKRAELSFLLYSTGSTTHRAPTAQILSEHPPLRCVLPNSPGLTLSDRALTPSKICFPNPLWSSGRSPTLDQANLHSFLPFVSGCPKMGHTVTRKTGRRAA